MLRLMHGGIVLGRAVLLPASWCLSELQHDGERRHSLAGWLSMAVGVELVVGKGGSSL